MKIILHPISDLDEQSLKDLYSKAISEAIELFIITAYLTNWTTESTIREDCEEFSFIVGTDFGITTKKACRSVLKWFPEKMKNSFLAVDSISGFHPKLVLWKNFKGECNIVLGSSNITQAAFSRNFEANVYSSIPVEQYYEIKKWIYDIQEQCTPISEDWVDKYTEATRLINKPGGKKNPVVSFILPTGKDIEAAIKVRRAQQKAFMGIKDEFVTLIQRCASGKISNSMFYQKMMSLWGCHESRLQGRGFEILGKHSHWNQICVSLSAILENGDKPVSAMDNMVRKEIDKLTETENPNRGAWFSEMLCHFFPDRYPIRNKPVKDWLKYNKYRAPRKASEGARYIDLSVKLRNALKTNKAYKAKNLAELDHAIWKWCDNNQNSQDESK